MSSLPTNYDNFFEPNNALHGTRASIEILSGQSPLDRQPSNENFLYPTYFKFFMQRLPKMTYTVTKVNLPQFGSDAAVEQDNRFTKIKHTPNRVSFANLEVQFLVDEDMSNWLEIYDWIKSTSLVEDHVDFDDNIKDHYSDATLMITNSAMNPNVEVQFKSIFPISLTGIDFDSGVTDLTAVQCTATFVYDYYTVRKL